MAGITITRGLRHALLGSAFAGTILAGCQTGPFARGDGSETAAADAAPSARSVRLVDRDVEAPEVFQVTDAALWDGRPSLGGVWVASPDAKDPERVILRNPENGKFVIGALFRREPNNPGPALQISSDAASALGLLAGQPGQVNVTALRREEAPETAPDATQPILDAAETVETTALDPIAAAGAAIDRADGAAPPPVADALPAQSVEASAATTGSPSAIQIGIFSVEANATRAADALKAEGIGADVRRDEAKGKAFWSVTASGTGDRAALLTKVKGLGFADAYFLQR